MFTSAQTTAPHCTIATGQLGYIKKGHAGHAGPVVVVVAVVVAIVAVVRPVCKSSADPDERDV